jgi:uncharacterized protein (DUF1015 family)
MGLIAPFSAIRYDYSKCGGDVSGVIAPPYDVLNQGDKDALLARSDRNIVGIDLPHLPPKSAGPVEAYERSAAMLDQWLGDGTLMREEKPSLYLYHQCFEHGGRQFTRRMFIARVRLVPFSDGSVLPHEKTFGGPKEDRLALMKATKVQLSPIFGIFSDPADAIGTAFSKTASDSPDATGTLDGVDNRLWIVSDETTVDAVVSVMSDKSIYIADGHHRYGTALLYRDYLVEKNGGPLPEDHPANWIMFVLASMDDPGCLILPYNRSIGQIDVATLLNTWSEGVESCGADVADVVLLEGSSGVETPVRFTNRSVLGSLAPDACEAWRRLDYAYLHRYLLDELLAKKLGKEPKLHYVKSVEAAKKAARDHDGVALLVKATPMEILRGVSEAGGLMPQKSTYFFPKLATGLAMNPLG